MGVIEKHRGVVVKISRAFASVQLTDGRTVFVRKRLGLGLGDRVTVLSERIAFKTFWSFG
jgi:hypothetical protein